MNRNKILVTILAIIGLMFVVLLYRLTNQTYPELNQSTKQLSLEKQPAVKGAEASLAPFQVKVTAGSTFSIKLSYQNLKTSIQAADLILAYDPTLIEFVDINNLNSNYINPRALDENGRLVVSFIEQTNQAQTDNKLAMADLVFKALKPGSTVISPTINTGPDSSMVIVENSQDNQLTAVNQIRVTVN